MRHAPAQVSLFGGVELPHRYAPKTISAKANGYAAPPGTGPDGESCGSCANCRVRRGSSGGYAGGGKRFYKCALMLPVWSSCRSSDVLLRSPACKQWRPGTPNESHVSRVHQPGWED